MAKRWDAGGRSLFVIHYSLFIIAKNLYNPKKTAETSNNEILNGASKIHAVVITIIMHIMKFLGIIKNPCGRKRETIVINFAWPYTDACVESQFTGICGLKG